MVAENEFGSTLGDAAAIEEAQTAVESLSSKVGYTSHDSLNPLVSRASPVKIPGEPADILKKSNIKSKKSEPTTSSLSTRYRLEQEAVFLEQQTQADVIALDRKFALRQKHWEMELEAQKEAQEWAATEREKSLEIKITKLKLGAGIGSSRSSLSSVSKSIRTEDKSKKWVDSPIKKFGGTCDPPVTAATLTAKSQEICNSGGDSSAGTGTAEVKLVVSQFKVSPAKATGLIYDPDNSFIPSTVRQPAGLPASAPQN